LETPPTILGPIHEAALSFLTATLAQHWQNTQPNTPKRIWLTHSSPKLRDQLSTELSRWNTAIENVVSFPDRLEQLSSAGKQLDDPENAAERIAALQHLSYRPSKLEVVVLSPEALESTVPCGESISSSEISLRVGDDLDLHALTATLSDSGYEKVAQLHARGQWAQRGGIVDIFTYQSIHPLRIELFDTEIDSLREFDLHSQISRKRLQQAALLVREPKAAVTLRNYVGEDDYLLSYGESAIKGCSHHFSSAPLTDYQGESDFSTACYASPLKGFSASDFVMQENQRKLFTTQVDEWSKEGWDVHLVFTSSGEQERFTELMGGSFSKSHRLTQHTGYLHNGFIIPEAKLAILSSAELFGRYQTVTRHNQHLTAQRKARAQADLEEIREGDLVVHNEYGIGRFKQIAVNKDGLEEIHIRFRDSVILSVPLDQSHLIARYVGMGGKPPQLSKLGDGKWSKTRKAAEAAILDYAAQLLRIQAERHSRPGRSHNPDDKWMWEFESSFPYTETPGQLEAIEDVKADMEAAKPMDRLICGDVGFGKTEVAIRAIFKAVCGGSQVAILVPTTVLAEQHWRNFKERMSHYPFRIDLLNRFRKPAEVRKTLAGLADGSVDVVVGTHRLVSDDVAFKKLGLVVIDEEQRFGVKHKEKFKQRFNQVDVLTLSATPIPRTLYLSLMGARDMSTIDTPPPNKVPVETSICGYDERIIRDAIQREMKRGGQVFFLHNRVDSIEMIKKRLNDLVPDVKIVIGHGQMDKGDLEKVMRQFVTGEADILLSTTIIESGIDIPNANTILIDRADRFGLADLYQLRGRVGRGGQKAYAILLLPRELVTGDARRRIEAIQQYTALGSGFKIAMRDLEIRGAGNLLGTKQSGHISAVGFDLYCQLLKQSIDRLRGGKPLQRVEVNLRCDFLCFNEGQNTSNAASGKADTIPCYIPAKYMPEARMRIQAYKQLAEATSSKQLKSIKAEWSDRYGKLAKPAKYLLATAELKIAAAQANVSAIEVKSQKLMITRNGDYIMLEGRRFPRLTEVKPEKKLNECIELIRSI